MDALECIRSRKSVRKFLTVPVAWEKIGVILEAGQQAPSGGNLQHSKFIAILDPQKRRRIAELCREQFWMENAPVYIVVCTDREKNERYYDDEEAKLFHIHDGASIIMSMLLAAHAEGLGACWVGSFDRLLLQEELGVPDSGVIHAVIPIGYSDDKSNKTTKRELHMMVFFERYGRKVKDMVQMSKEYSEQVTSALRSVKDFLNKFRGV